MKKRSKRYKSLKEQLKAKKVNNFEAAISEIKKMSNPKFSESIDVSLKVNFVRFFFWVENIQTTIFGVKTVYIMRLNLIMIILEPHSII